MLCLSCHLTRHARNSYRLLPQGYCEQKPLNLEKKKYSVSVLLLIYATNIQSRSKNVFGFDFLHNI